MTQQITIPLALLEQLVKLLSDFEASRPIPPSLVLQTRTILPAARAAITNGVDAPNPREMHQMLQCMQAGEMTVSRGVELLDMWLAGDYTHDQLPPCGELLPDDKMPWDVIKELRAAIDGADHKKFSVSNTSTGTLPQRIESIFEAMDKEVAAGRLVRTGPLEWSKT